MHRSNDRDRKPAPPAPGGDATINLPPAAAGSDATIQLPAGGDATIQLPPPPSSGDATVNFAPAALSDATIQFTPAPPIANDATRTAALISGELDFILDPPPRDVARLRSTAGVKVIDGHVTLPDLPGIGFEAKSDLYGQMRDLAA